MKNQWITRMDVRWFAYNAARSTNDVVDFSHCVFVGVPTEALRAAFRLARANRAQADHNAIGAHFPLKQVDLQTSHTPFKETPVDRALVVQWRRSPEGRMRHPSMALDQAEEECTHPDASLHCSLHKGDSRIRTTNLPNANRSSKVVALLDELQSLDNVKVNKLQAQERVMVSGLRVNGGDVYLTFRPPAAQESCLYSLSSSPDGIDLWSLHHAQRDWHQLDEFAQYILPHVGDYVLPAPISPPDDPRVALAQWATKFSHLSRWQPVRIPVANHDPYYATVYANMYPVRFTPFHADLGKRACVFFLSETYAQSVINSLRLLETALPTLPDTRLTVPVPKLTGNEDFFGTVTETTQFESPQKVAVPHVCTTWVYGDEDLALLIETVNRLELRKGERNRRAAYTAPEPEFTIEVRGDRQNSKGNSVGGHLQLLLQELYYPVPGFTGNQCVPDSK